MRKKTAIPVTAVVNGVKYDGRKEEDREKLRTMGFAISDDGTSIETPAAGGSQDTINVHTGHAKNVIQTNNRKPDIEGGVGL